jgi:hypothetical protein
LQCISRRSRRCKIISETKDQRTRSAQAKRASGRAPRRAAGHIGRCRSKNYSGSPSRRAPSFSSSASARYRERLIVAEAAIQFGRAFNSELFGGYPATQADATWVLRAVVIGHLRGRPMTTRRIARYIGMPRKRHTITDMKKIAFICAMMVAATPSWASELDFPHQLAAINNCYDIHNRESLLPGTNAELRRCMREHGFSFCPKCTISGLACRSFTEGAHHSECYRLIGRVNEKGFPTDDGPKSNTEKEWDDTVYRLIHKWSSLNSACRTPIVDDRKCDEFKMTEDILRDSHCTKVAREDTHWECPRFKDLPASD